MSDQKYLFQDLTSYLTDEERLTIIYLIQGWSSTGNKEKKAFYFNKLNKLVQDESLVEQLITHYNELKLNKDNIF